MGRSSKPLKIITLYPCNGWEEITAYAEQGHDIVKFPDITDWETCDLILSDRAWLMDEQHRKYLPLALAEARRRRYPPTKKESA